jgi:hypothetical protein
MAGPPNETAPSLRKARKSRGRLGTPTGRSYFFRERRKVTAPWGQVTSKYSKFSKSFLSVTAMAILMEFIATRA